MNQLNNYFLIDQPKRIWQVLATRKSCLLRSQTGVRFQKRFSLTHMPRKPFLRRSVTLSLIEPPLHYFSLDVNFRVSVTPFLCLSFLAFNKRDYFF